MALPSASEITRLFLYGTTSVPNLLDSALIRSSVPVTKETAVVRLTDVNEYMNQGPGRFVNAASFEVINRFFSGRFDSASQGLRPSPVEGYTKEQMFEQ